MLVMECLAQAKACQNWKAPVVLSPCLMRRCVEDPALRPGVEPCCLFLSLLDGGEWSFLGGSAASRYTYTHNASQTCVGEEKVRR